MKFVDGSSYTDPDDIFTFGMILKIKDIEHLLDRGLYDIDNKLDREVAVAIESLLIMKSTKTKEDEHNIWRGLYAMFGKPLKLKNME